MLSDSRTLDAVLLGVLGVGPISTRAFYTPGGLNVCGSEKASLSE